MKETIAGWLILLLVIALAQPLYRMTGDHWLGLMVMLAVGSTTGVILALFDIKLHGRSR